MFTLKQLLPANFGRSGNTLGLFFSYIIREFYTMRKECIMTMWAYVLQIMKRLRVQPTCPIQIFCNTVSAIVVGLGL